MIIQTIICLTEVIFPNSKMATKVPRLLQSEELKRTGQDLLCFIELKTFRSVTEPSIFIGNTLANG